MVPPLVGSTFFCESRVLKGARPNKVHAACHSHLRCVRVLHACKLASFLLLLFLLNLVLLIRTILHSVWVLRLNGLRGPAFQQRGRKQLWLFDPPPPFRQMRQGGTKEP